MAGSGEWMVNSGEWMVIIMIDHDGLMMVYPLGKRLQFAKNITMFKR